MSYTGTPTPLLKRISKGFGNLLALTCLVTLGACATTTAPPPSATTEDVGFTEDYRIGVGDALSINVWRNDDLSVQVPVRPDGKVSVPLAGDVTVGNKTPEEVSAEITERLSKFIRDPYVTVIVTNMGSADYRSRVRVTGAVNAPSSTPYRQGMTVLDVVLEAGGLTEFANPSKATLFRKNGDRIAVDLRGILNRGDMSTNYSLMPGDVITVPERAF
jgi:polysaccharide export outer membrane protein